MCIAGGVHACSTEQCIGASHAFQYVVTAATGDAVVMTFANQRVGEARADHVFDTAEGVTKRIVGLCDGRTTGKCGTQGGDHAKQGIFIADGVRTGSTDENIGTTQSLQKIVADTPVEGVGNVVSNQGVVKGGSCEILDILEGVTQGIIGLSQGSQ